MLGDRHPSKPRFEAEQPPLQDLRHEPLPEEHPLRGVLDRVVYPAGREDVVEACLVDERVTEEQREWLVVRLPDGRYGSSDHVVRALGVGGLEPPSRSTGNLGRPGPPA